MTLALITDPYFYIVSVPAVLLMGVSKSGFGSGFGSLAVPVMAMAVTVPQAVAIFMPILLLMDVLGMAAFRKDFDASLLKFLIPCGLAGIALGALLFKLLDAHMVAGIVGAVTLVFLAQRWLFRPKVDSVPPPKWMGAILTATTGFTSFIAHSGGPPINAYVIPMRLSPVRFSATMAFFFFVMNLAKWIPYALLGLLDLRNLLTSLVLLPIAPLGVWLGVWMTRRMNPLLFYRLVYVGMFLTALKLLSDAFG